MRLLRRIAVQRFVELSLREEVARFAARGWRCAPCQWGMLLHRWPHLVGEEYADVVHLRDFRGEIGELRISMPRYLFTEQLRRRLLQRLPTSIGGVFLKRVVVSFAGKQANAKRFSLELTLADRAAAIRRELGPRLRA